VAARRGSFTLAKHQEQSGMKLLEVARSGQRLSVLWLDAHSRGIKRIASGARLEVYWAILSQGM
jgi:hypothetical protein